MIEDYFVRIFRPEGKEDPVAGFVEPVGSDTAHPFVGPDDLLKVLRLAGKTEQAESAESAESAEP